MLKTTILPEKSTPKQLGIDDGEVNRFSINCGVEYVKKSEKMSKSQNLAKSRKKLSKSRNSTNFNATEAGPKFLNPNTRTAFNHLWLAFTRTLILWHFNPKCYIWIETDISDYAISGVLNQLISRTSPNEIVIKTNLGQ